ncbi:MAG TPA: lipopolysaccharide heptosyltransferase I [Tepidisphaeraceae bacterium]|jgi:lipopolysaccharide heptosyltransferase I
MNRIELPSPPRRILLIKPSALGDVVHTLPVLNLLRRRWPDANITWLIASAFAGLVEGHPQLSDVITFDRNRLAQSWYNPRAAVELLRFIRGLRLQPFDLVIDLQGLFRSGTLTALTRAPVRVGFSNARELAHLFYTHHVPIDTMDQHAIDRCLNVTEALGCGREPVEFHFVTGDGDRSHIDQLLNGVGRYAVLLPGTNWLTKRWPIDKFASIVQPLRQQLGLSTIVAGGPDVVELAAQIPSAVNLAGKTTLRQLVALIERSQLVIANDSGPMHIAAALNKPLVTMFGPTNPLRTGPYRRLESVVRVDIPCSPCYSRKCSHTSCMRWISSEAVMAESAQQLRSP